ncbi:MAG: hypothetical protein WAS72_00375 [Saprospiraceae bacterium]
MKSFCKQCKTPITGRSDKAYCSTECKNLFNNALRKGLKAYTQEVDVILHRNHAILALLMGNTKKDTFDKLVLTKAGFKFDFMTGIYFNKEGKLYKIVYDFAVMEFSDQKVLVVRKSK